MEKKVPRARLVDMYEDMFKPTRENFEALEVFLFDNRQLPPLRLAWAILEYFHEKQKQIRNAQDEAS